MDSSRSLQCLAVQYFHRSEYAMAGLLVRYVYAECTHLYRICFSVFPLASSVYRVKGEIPSVHPMQMHASKKPVEYKEIIQNSDAAGCADVRCRRHLAHSCVRMYFGAACGPQASPVASLVLFLRRRLAVGLMNRNPVSQDFAIKQGTGRYSAIPCGQSSVTL